MQGSPDKSPAAAMEKEWIVKQACPFNDWLNLPIYIHKAPKTLLNITYSAHKQFLKFQGEEM